MRSLCRYFLHNEKAHKLLLGRSASHAFHHSHGGTIFSTTDHSSSAGTGGHSGAAAHLNRFGETRDEEAARIQLEMQELEELRKAEEEVFFFPKFVCSFLLNSRC